jgi:tellurite resistance protein TerC
MPVGATTILGGAPVWLWVLFHLVIFALLGADFFLTRDALSPATIERRSYGLSGAWIAAALLFSWLMARVLTLRFGLEYLTGYGIEEALSIDNLFVFLVLFRAFRLPPASQRRVLFFGVLGAILMRVLMIAAGIRLLQAFTWTNYLFGAILIYTAGHLLWKSAGSQQERAPRWVDWLTTKLSASGKDHGTRFLTREGGRLRATPLLLALIAIEGTDAMFATDSIPAVLAVSHHPFVVYSSNIFAVLGLRSLYFTLAAALERLHKLRYGLAAILAFVGGKMMLTEVVNVPIWVSMIVLATSVGITALWSFLSEPAAIQD